MGVSRAVYSGTPGGAAVDLCRRPLHRPLLEDLAVLQPEGGQGPPPGAAGVEPSEAVAEAEAQRRPVAEDHERAVAPALRHGEPGNAPLRSVLRRAAELRAHPAVLLD